MQSDDQLKKWDLVIINKKIEKSHQPREIKCGGISFNAVQRRCTFKDEDKIVIQRLVNRTDEMLDFSKEERKSMKNKFTEENEGRTSITGAFMRTFRPLNRGLLLIYGVEDSKKDSKDPFGGPNDKPYYGFAASFPANKSNQRFNTMRKRPMPYG